MMRFLLALTVALSAAPALATFTMDDDGQRVTIIEDGKPVLAYHYGMADPPKRVPERYRRAGYIHPLYGLDGEVLTEDFPIDHRHHRGVFWAWPNSTVDGKPIDVWALDGVRQRHEKWLLREASEDSAVLEAQSVWSYDEKPGEAQMRETLRMTVLPAKEMTRSIAVKLSFENVSGKEFIVRGATTDNKGYGGFCIRPDARLKPMHFTASMGKIEEDMLRLESPWVDVSFSKTPKSKELSGVAIFEHPSFPGFPHPGWILRDYAFLGQSWPHTEPHVMQPGDTFTLEYLLVVHRGSAEAAGIAGLFEAFVKQSK